jgi:hypothetical protein
MQRNATCDTEESKPAPDDVRPADMSNRTSASSCRTTSATNAVFRHRQPHRGRLPIHENGDAAEPRDVQTGDHASHAEAPASNDAGAGAHGRDANEPIARVRDGGQSAIDAITSVTSLDCRRRAICICTRMADRPCCPKCDASQWTFPVYTARPRPDIVLTYWRCIDCEHEWSIVRPAVEISEDQTPTHVPLAPGRFRTE